MKVCSRCDVTKPLSAFGEGGKKAQCKKCLADYAREYRRLHPEKARASFARWYAANPERARMHRERFRAENPNYGAEYRDKNREAEKARKAKHRCDHPDYAVRYYAAHAAEERAKIAAYRARKCGAAGTTTVEQIAGRWEVYGGRCYLCGNPAEATDHVIPLVAGGSNWPANLRPVCTSCNSAKAGKWPYDIERMVI